MVDGVINRVYIYIYCIIFMFLKLFWNGNIFLIPCIYHDKFVFIINIFPRVIQRYELENKRVKKERKEKNTNPINSESEPLTQEIQSPAECLNIFQSPWPKLEASIQIRQLSANHGVNLYLFRHFPEFPPIFPSSHHP